MAGRPRLSGKVAIVTGAAQGIGRASAIKFAEEGATVFACDIQASKLNELEEFDRIKPMKLDVTSREEINDISKQVGPVDILLNCAGYVPDDTILTFDEEVWQRTVNLNVCSIIRMCQKFIQMSIDNDQRLTIINISSVAGSILGAKDRFTYSVTKSALTGLMKSVAADFTGKGIRINNICPGTVDTPSFRERVSHRGNPESNLKSFLSRQKMGRLGTPEEIAFFATYLASDESAFTTGQDFTIDGGWSV